MREGPRGRRARTASMSRTISRASYGTRPTSPHKSSMLQDFERNRPPEIDGILTSVQAFARAAALPTPRLDAVTALVIEKARKAWALPAADW